MGNVIFGFIILLISIAVARGLNKSGNKVDNVKEELRDLAAETSNGLTDTIGKLNRKLNNWRDPKIDMYTAQKRLERTDIKYQIKYEGNRAMITALDKSWSRGFDGKPGQYFSVEYQNGKYVRWSFADNIDGIDFEHLTNNSGKQELEKCNPPTGNKKKTSYKNHSAAEINKPPKPSSEKTLPKNIRDLYWYQEEDATEEPYGTSHSSIEANDCIDTSVQNTDKESATLDNDLIIHHFDRLQEKVAEYKNGTIDIHEILIIISRFISTVWPNYSKQKQSALFQALTEHIGIDFE